MSDTSSTVEPIEFQTDSDSDFHLSTLKISKSDNSEPMAVATTSKRKKRKARKEDWKKQKRKIARN